MIRVYQIVTLILIFSSCTSKIVGTWTHEKTIFNFEIDSTVTGKSSYIELDRNDTLFFDNSNQTFTSLNTFQGKWEIEGSFSKKLLMDVEWGPEANEVNLGAGAYLYFDIIELSGKELVMISHNSRGTSTHYFKRN